MSSNDFQIYKERLLIMRARLRGDVTQMADTALRQNRNESELSSMPIHMADVGSDNFEREFTLQLMQSGHATLQQINNALRRIEDGTYDVCEVCGAKIPKKRLQAVPYTSMCVKCAEKEEDVF
ncbi:MAG: TraR/DksA C4-type zinc finger protein [Planctomycetia bacterium]|nr:TraR/DksA C4-type zinc finger protein [Planctomycetia bacterium]